MANSDKQLKNLTRERGNVKGQLTRFMNTLKSESVNLNIYLLENRQLKLNALEQSYENIQSSIEEINSEIDWYEERESFENLFLECCSLLGSKMEELKSKEIKPPATASNETPISTNNTITVKQINALLPKMEIKPFDGNPVEWQGFYDAFKTLIHDNSEYPAVHKFYFLKNSLKGDVASVIASLNASEESYIVAWDLLQKRCNKPRQIIHAHLNSFLELPQIEKESPQKLKALAEKTEMHINALKALKEPVEHWDAILVLILVKKLDKVTRRAWDRSLDNEEMPKFSDLLKFINKRARSDELEVNNSNQKASRVHSHIVNSCDNCPICKKDHDIIRCNNFLELPAKERHRLVKQAGLCTNCLRSNHNAYQCKSYFTCRICKQKHNTLLHLSRNVNEKTTMSGNNSSNNTSTALPELTRTSHTSVLNSEIFLGTAQIKIFDKWQNEFSCRVLIDTGSQVNFITERLAHKLNLDKEKSELPLFGLGEKCTKSQFTVKTKIKSRTSQFESDISFTALPKITGRLPSIRINKTDLQIPENIVLADPKFNESLEIDALLGNTLAYRLFSIGQIELPNALLLQKSKLGWLVTGEIQMSNVPNRATSCHLITSLDKQISKFWEIEEISAGTHLSPEEVRCENHFIKNTSRDSDGKYIVSLPFNESPLKLGDSHKSALKRFYSLERKLIQNEGLYKQYKEFLDEYKSLGHMVEVTNNTSDGQGYYLPHHAVIKESSATTKVRVVFDASAKTTTGLSLNDKLLVGPKIQDDLVQTLMRFRKHKIAFTADIEKMFRMIKIQPRDCKYQKIFWRENPEQQIKTYELQTVTYGTASAPFLATRILKQIAQDEMNNFPVAAHIIKRDFYMDDLLSGANSLPEALLLKEQLVQLLKSGGFNLRQWVSNKSSLMQQDANLESKNLFPDPTDTKGVLGVRWNPNLDTINYSVMINNEKTRITKRLILSQIAQIFDPLGLLGPVIVDAKLIMQDLWKENLHWDASVGQTLYDKWIRFKSELPLLNKFRVERNLIIDDAKTIELHGFCDASEKAYGCCIYIRSSNELNCIQTQLLCSKSRVAPLKTISLPRLELCAALLLAKLFRYATDSLKIEFNKTMFWSDSTVALNWIKTAPHTLKTFVANRVSSIQSLTDLNDWYHVRSSENPADTISRGEIPSKFINNVQWINDPCWLSQDESSWQIVPLEEINVPEQRHKVALHVHIEPISILFERFSSFSALVRFVALCRRLICKVKLGKKQTGEIQTGEIQEAKYHILKLIQEKHFSLEIKDMQQGQDINKKSKIITLLPFIDDSGILRVGGRLKHAPIGFSQKHPILLPPNDHVTKIIIRQEHVKNWHSGIQTTLNIIRNNYWIIDGKNTIRNIIHKCVRCRKLKPEMPKYPMGNLPISRFERTRPFINVGIDYCGPFFIKEKKFRNKTKIKAYVAVFVCFATKAVHLELVSDLTSEATLAAIKRFCARRGKPKNIYTDNATNFVGTKNEIRSIYATLQSEEYNCKINHALVNDQINWHFIPPRSPHFGGIWEAAVKSFKHHLYRTIGDSLFTFEQFNSYIIEIEAILNSRPLTPLSSDPNDLIPLTPAHFLIGDSLASLPDVNLNVLPANRLSQWQLINRIKQHFWSRWQHEYLNELQVRNKWLKHEATNMDIGTLVVLKEDNLPPMNWNIGRIVNVHPGDDGVIRVVTVKTSSGTYKRSVKKLCPLLHEQS